MKSKTKQLTGFIQIPLESLDSIESIKEFIDSLKKTKSNVFCAISCTKQKYNGRMPLKKLYSKSALFRWSWEVANRIINEEKIFILSAKHGFKHGSFESDYYDATLNDNPLKNYLWNARVRREFIEAMHSFGFKEGDVFVFFASYKYAYPFSGFLRNLGITAVNFFPLSYGLFERRKLLRKLLGYDND